MQRRRQRRRPAGLVPRFHLAAHPSTAPHAAIHHGAVLSPDGVRSQQGGGSGSYGQKALHGISQTTTRDQPRPTIFAADGGQDGPICGGGLCANERGFMLQWIALLLLEAWFVSRQIDPTFGGHDRLLCQCIYFGYGSTAGTPGSDRLARDLPFAVAGQLTVAYTRTRP